METPSATGLGLADWDGEALGEALAEALGDVLTSIHKAC